ncbi:MAG: Ig-like domain-containing protein [Myxococcota bacterium]
MTRTPSFLFSAIAAVSLGACASSGVSDAALPDAQASLDAAVGADQGSGMDSGLSPDAGSEDTGVEPDAGMGLPDSGIPGFSVTLTADSAHVTAAGSLLLTAVVTSAVGVQSVSFLDNGVAIGSDSSAPYTWTVALTDASNGNHVYTAVALDNNDDQATSNAVPVLVEIPAPTRGYWVDVMNGDDNSNPCTQAAPCKTIAHTVVGAPPGTTVELEDGAYGPLEPAGGGLEIPDGVRLHAVHPRQASLVGISITVLGSGGLEDVVLDGALVEVVGPLGPATFDMVGVVVRGTGGGAAVHVGGMVTATLQPGTLPGGDYTDATTRPGDLFSVTDNARLTIQGGAFGAHDMGNRVALVRTPGTLILDGVSIHDRTTTALAVLGDATLRNGTSLRAVGGGGLFGDKAILMGGSGHLIVDSSTIADCAHTGIAFPAMSVATVELTNSVLSRNRAGVQSEGPANAPGATVRLSNVIARGNTDYGVQLNGPGTVAITSSTLSGGGYGVVGLSVALSVHGSDLSGNDVGIRVVDPVSTDLGTAALAGGNTLSGDVTTGLQIATATPGAGPIDVAGNLWNPGIQGADGSGHYAAGTTATGLASGRNFAVQAQVGGAGTQATLHF